MFGSGVVADGPDVVGAGGGRCSAAGWSLMGRTLLVTNDFPPRPGGIERFIHNMAIRLRPESLVVYASARSGARTAIGRRSEIEEFDAAQPFPVVREPTAMLLPLPGVARRAVELARRHECDTVLFGAAAPLGLLAGTLRRDAKVRRVVSMTHGHETGWAALPGARSMLRRIGRDSDVVTFLGDYTRTRLARVLGGLTTLAWLAPGVDVDVYRPDVDGTPIRRRHHLGGRPVIVCVSRLVPRKGQDVLIRALPLVREQVPDAALLIVGTGPYGESLRRLARRTGVADDVVFTGEVPWAEVPAHFAAGDVFAMPCRTRRAGLDVEGLGIVFLEASATGLPVVVGGSGGAPDAVIDSVTGYTVAGTDVSACASRISQVLRDADLAHKLGTAGRQWIEERWQWSQQAARLQDLLDGRG